ncbi:restriction endonuclease [Micromonospora sp. SL4-19]|uniref:restriction endonuclease n=1 Tax=Micromonospora sp. SL4-19 TaxID=3399129 RepID=UPI003A4E4D48
MPYVRSHPRKNGARARAHHRTRRRAGSARASAARRRTGSRRSGLDLTILFAVLAVVVLVVLVVDFVGRHPYWSAFLAVLVVGAIAAVLALVSRQRSRQRAAQAERDRLIAVTDAMSGAEFERWFARLLVTSGFRQVRVVGGAGDRGADVTAVAPDGRRVVVQCKRQSSRNRVGSAAIQRFAGTCREIHGGELCMIVTNGFFTNGGGVHLARRLGIILVDRRLLEMWAWTGRPPVATA